jgi:hypothetical protein
MGTPNHADAEPARGVLPARVVPAWPGHLRRTVRTTRRVRAMRAIGRIGDGAERAQQGWSMRTTAETGLARAAPASFLAGCAGWQLTCARPALRMRPSARGTWGTRIVRNTATQPEKKANLASAASAGGENGSGNNCLGADAWRRPRWRPSRIPRPPTPIIAVIMAVVTSTS